MTATLDAEPLVEVEGSESFDPQPEVEVEDRDRCTWLSRDGSRCEGRMPTKRHPQQVYCDGHREGGELRVAETGSKRGKPPWMQPTTDKGAPRVEFNIKTGTPRATKLDKSQERVAEAAKTWLGLLAAVLDMQGDATCAEAIRKGTPNVAIQLAELSKYHPVIEKVLCPMEASGEIATWIALSVAVFPIVIAILAHHNLLSPKLAERVGAFAMVGNLVTNKPE